MATDATGTPTSKGIPKYDPANDAPSGLGFNAAMDAIDTLLGWAKLRKNSAGTVFSRGRINLIEGSGVTITVADDAGDNEIDVTIASTASIPTVTYDTVLPGSPSDGQEAILVDSVTAPTYAWRFRYNAGSANTFKWEFIGGSPAVHEIATTETTSSGTYVDLSTVGPSITIPRSGIYVVTLSLFSHHSAAVATTTIRYAAVKLGAAATSDNESVAMGEDNGSVSMTHTSSNSFRRQLAASDVLKVQYRQDGGTGTAQFAKRILQVIPVQVS